MIQKIGSLIPFNYQYPLSSAIYKIIQRADKEFATFLHNKGYGEGHKSFKLFTFSDIRTPFVFNGDRMQLTTTNAELIICFYLPKAAETFIRGLFLHQHLEIADRASKAVFHISGVESLTERIPGSGQLILQPISPVVVGRKNERGHYDYRSPEDDDFAEYLYYNWMEKCAAVGLPVGIGADAPAIKIEVLFFKHPPQQRLITIKGGSEAETKIRGYTKFRLAIEAPVDMIEVALGSGLGLHNAQGMGCVEVIN